MAIEWKKVDGKISFFKRDYPVIQWLEYCKLAQVDDINTEVITFKVTEVSTCKYSEI
jgi:hypothetical protein